jgi:hypothetical protein
MANNSEEGQGPQRAVMPVMMMMMMTTAAFLAYFHNFEEIKEGLGDRLPACVSVYISPLTTFQCLNQCL